MTMAPGENSEEDAAVAPSAVAAAPRIRPSPISATQLQQQEELNYEEKLDKNCLLSQTTTSFVGGGGGGGNNNQIGKAAVALASPSKSKSMFNNSSYYKFDSATMAAAASSSTTCVVAKTTATTTTASTTLGSNSQTTIATVSTIPSSSTTATTTTTTTTRASPVVTPDRSTAAAASATATETIADPSSSQNKKQKTASEWKEEGNRAYTHKQYHQALEAYNRGLEMCTEEEERGDDNDSVMATLYANRAMVLIKLEDYVAAEETCTNLLEQTTPATSKNKTTSYLHKVWFRRALARQNRAKELAKQQQEKKDDLTPQQVKQLLQQQRVFLLLAKSDLQSSLRAAEEDPTMSKKQQEQTKKIVGDAAQRLRQDEMILDLKTRHGLPQRNKAVPGTPPSSSHKRGIVPVTTMYSQKPANNTNNNITNKPKKRLVPDNRNLPPVMQQKNDIVRLLMARLASIQQRQRQLPGGAAESKSTVTAVHGEAFFFLDWQWWTQFCRHVGLFGDKDDVKMHSKVLSFFPPGAIVPESVFQKWEDDDDDFIGPPGPIDNSCLFLLENWKGGINDDDVGDKSTSQVFCEQWYHKPEQQPKGYGNSNGNPPLPALKPNLVRGYHYEIIPREVYSALREWYTELTPSICRRAQLMEHGNMTVPLYLLPPLRVNKTGSLYNHCCGACQAPVDHFLRCKNCSAVYYCDRGCQANHWPIHKQECRVLAKAEEEGDGQQPKPEALVRIRPPSDGKVGLNNLGNTCFMNSALQCLSHATPLTRLFLSGKFKLDLNTANPLGTGGRLAFAYETVMKELWMRAGQQRSYSPTTLKRAITQFAPRFAGCLQHDAQEFLAYLLDGLHEDLNRIRKAPYVEMPDVMEGQDMAVAGARAWDAHRRRNDSLVMDSFYGQFKSTCVCPQCNRVSVSFDAFNHVSLEIPQQQNAIITLQICVVRLPQFLGEDVVEGRRADKSITRYALSVRRNTPVPDLKEELSKLANIPLRRLHLTELWDQDVKELYSDDKLCGHLSLNDIVAFEAEPIDARPSFHVFVKNKVLSKTPQPPKHNGVLLNVDEEEEEEVFVTIGNPSFLSFPIEASCRQVCEYLWALFADKIDEPYRDQYKATVEFRLVNGRGRDLAVFPDLSAPQQDGAVENQRTSLIPKHSDNELFFFVGKQALERFTYIDIEWRDQAQQVMTKDEKGEDMVVTRGGIQEERFWAVSNHVSWVEYSARQSAQKASKGVSLDQCFETFVKPERLDERNMWYCSSCKEHVRAMKTMELWRLPNILVVHLKRFEFRNVLRRDKLDTLVNFPLDGLDMSSHCPHDTNKFVDDYVPAEYDLFAVVNHYGRMGFGHYTAFARNWNERGMSNDWYLFDDSRVQSVGGGEPVVSNAAYVLFYRRRVWN